MLAGLACILLLALRPTAGWSATPASELFPLAAGTHARSLTFGPDGNVWFSGWRLFGENPSVIGKLTPGGEVTELELPIREGNAGAGAGAITVGPDGNLWVALTWRHRIARVSPAGEVALFELPWAPSVITAGPDGNLWFTAPEAGAIGRITPSGEVTFRRLGPHSAPHGIVAGPDGALWFTEYRAGRIGRMIPNGHVSHFRLARGVRPRSIAVGPDGNLWFTEAPGAKGRAGRNRIGRITPAGKVTQFRVRAPWGTGSIFARPPAGIWFTAGRKAAGTELGSISTQGQALGYRCLSDNCRLRAESLALGPEGAIWFAAGSEYCEFCGAGSVMFELSLPGAIGRLTP